MDLPSTTAFTRSTHLRTVSNDNPFSEAHLKTLKDRPDFPDRFGSYEDAETFCQRFFPWCNTEHRHGALGLMTRHDIHYGLAALSPDHAYSSVGDLVLRHGVREEGR